MTFFVAGVSFVLLAGTAAAAQPSVTLTPGGTAFPSPIGITYSETLQQLILSVNFSSGSPNNFATVASDGTFSTFPKPPASVSGIGGEVYPTAIRTSGCEGGFTPGDFYFYDNNIKAIGKISNGVVTDPWVALPGETGVESGMTQDAACSFDGDLIVTLDDGNVWQVTSDGTTTEIATAVGAWMEGPTTVPNNPAYGPWAGKILVSDETCGCVYSVAGDGTHETWSQWPSAEGVAIIPADENLFAVDWGDSKLQQAPASEFTGVVGDVLVFTEGPGGLWDVRWNPTTLTFDTYDMLAAPGSGDVGQFEGVAFAPAALVCEVCGVAPGAIAQGVSNLPVKITGSGWFSTPATVSASAPGITFTKVVVKSPTLITAKASATAAVPAGTYDVTVKVGAVSQICTGCLQVLAQPTVSSITPHNLGQGASKVLVTITGSDFYAPAKVTFSGPGTGVTGAVKSISPTTLSVAVTVPQAATPGAYMLNLKNGDGGVASCGCLTVVVGPKITSFTPTSVARHHTTPFTVTGTGFSSDATLKGPSGVKFSNLSVTPDGTTITATMTVSATAPTGTNLPITVRNGPLGNYGAITDMALTITP